MFSACPKLTYKLVTFTLLFCCSSGALQGAPAVATPEEASSMCLPFKCMVNLLPSAPPEAVGDPPPPPRPPHYRPVTRVSCAGPIRMSPRATGSPLLPSSSPGPSLRSATLLRASFPRTISSSSISSPGESPSSSCSLAALPRSRSPSQQDPGPGVREQAGRPSSGGPSSGEQQCR